MRMRMMELERNGATGAVLQEQRWKSCLFAQLAAMKQQDKACSCRTWK